MTIWDDSAPLPWEDKDGDSAGGEPANPPQVDAQPTGFFDDVVDPFAQAPAQDASDPQAVDDGVEPAGAAPLPDLLPDGAAQEVEAPVQRGAGHLERMENEWRRLQRSFAYHPHVRVIPLEGDPPEQYQVEYRLRTVVMDESGQLQYASNCAVHIWLPPEFPHEPPLVRPVSELFHPNVVPEGINIDRYWTSTVSTLVDVITGVGGLLSYQDYDLPGAWNPTAAEWTAVNQRILPLDPGANFHPEAGADPLTRICRHGPRTLDQVRRELKQKCDALLAAESNPNPIEIRGLSERTRQGLTLFIEQDIPDELRITVGELDDFARELPLSLPAWEGLRRHREVTATAMQTARRARDAERSIEFEIKAVDALVNAQPMVDPLGAMRQLPQGETMEMHQQNIEGLIARADEVMGESRTLQGRVGALPLLSASSGSSLLQKRLDAELEKAAGTLAEARQKLAQMHDGLEPVLARARLHNQLLRRMIEWRSYADMVDRAEEFALRVLSYGPAGTQAFFIENESGRFGPFELEQKLTLGNTALIARNPASSILQIVSADSGAMLVQSDDGRAALPITDPESGAVFRTRFELSGNCDELAVQLDYAARESTAMLQRLATPLRSPSGWLGEFNKTLGDAGRFAKVQSRHEMLVRRWQTIRDDLRSLQPFKERLATFRMIQHMTDWLSSMIHKGKAARREQDEATARISHIVAGCNTDIESGRLLIPQRYVTEYPEQLDRRDRARHELRQLAEQAKRAIIAIQSRINNPALRGAAEFPQLLLLGKTPEIWETLLPQLSNSSIGNRLHELEVPLRVQLRPDDWPDDPEPILEQQALPSPGQLVDPGDDGI